MRPIYETILYILNLSKHHASRLNEHLTRHARRSNGILTGSAGDNDRARGPVRARIAIMTPDESENRRESSVNWAKTQFVLS